MVHKTKGLIFIHVKYDRLWISHPVAISIKRYELDEPGLYAYKPGLGGSSNSSPTMSPYPAMHKNHLSTINVSEYLKDVEFILH